MNLSHIEMEIHGDLTAVVTLARPPVNALNSEIRKELITVLDALQDRDDVRAIVLTARGSVFCAGADIKEKQGLAERDGAYRRANRLTREAFYAVLDSAKPIVAAVNGGALGAGLVLAACCDLILASEDAFFSMPEIDVGQGGGASFLQRLLPLPTMRRMMLTGERVPASELYRLGAVERVVAADELLPQARSLAATMAAKSPSATRAIKESFLTVEALGLREGFRLEQSYTTGLSQSDDAAEARRAFFERRAPRF